MVSITLIFNDGNQLVYEQEAVKIGIGVVFVQKEEEETTYPFHLIKEIRVHGTPEAMQDHL